MRWKTRWFLIRMTWWRPVTKAELDRLLHLAYSDFDAGDDALDTRLRIIERRLDISSPETWQEETARLEREES